MKGRISAIVLVWVMVLSGTVLVTGGSSEGGLASDSDLPTYDRYEYDPYIVAPTTLIEPSWSDTNGIGEEITTGWGKCYNWYNSNSLFADWGGLYYGADQIDSWIHSEYYTIYNYTEAYVVGRPTAPLYEPQGATFSNVYTRYSDSSVLIQEKFRENAASGFLSAQDFNVTIRYTIHKVIPIIRVDFWWVNQNATSDLSHISVQLAALEDFGATDIISIDPSKALTTYVAGDNGVTYGVVGWGIEDQAPQANFNTFTLGPWRDSTTERLHANMFILVGSNLSNVEALAEDLGDCWNDECDYNDNDLVIARDNDTGKFSAFKYFNTTTTIYPSGANCTVWANGEVTYLSQGRNPIENYWRAPVIYSWDDHYTGSVFDERYQTLFDMGARYELRMTLCLNPNSSEYLYPDSRIEMYYTKSQQYDWTLMEIGNHGFDHSGFATDTIAYEQVTQTEARWAAVGATPPTTSVVLPANYWGDAFLDGLEDAGIKSCRMGVYYGGNDSHMLDDDDAVLTYSFQSLSGSIDQTYFTNISEFADRWGYFIFQAHADDVGFEYSNHNLEELGTWLQNSTTEISTTMAQFYDLRHGLVRFTDSGGSPVLDLTNCTDDHPLYLNRTLLGQDYIFEDEATGVEAPWKILGDILIVYTRMGHTYVVEEDGGTYEPVQAAYTYVLYSGTVYFTDLSYGNPVSWVWNFGDGFGSTSANPSHRYEKSGVYTVSLTVTDALGHTSFAQGTVKIELSEDYPIERDDEGWRVFISPELTLSLPALGLALTGAMLLASASFVPDMPILTARGRRLIGGLCIAASVYFFLFAG